MDLVKDCRLYCEVCQKEFSSISTKNRHLKKFHEEIKIEKKRTRRIRCPLCTEEEKFSCYEHLIDHLKQFHRINIKECVLSFKNFEEFEAWRASENRDVDYACHRTFTHSNDDKDIYYNCNRSDSRGFTSTCHKRNRKSGGSIRIQGICPSRIVVKIHQNGTVGVKFVETHVGHTDKLRSKHLSEVVQNTPELSAGATNENITNSRISFEERRQMALDEICRFGRSLGEELFDKFMVDLNTTKNHFQEEQTGICKKRKVEKKLSCSNKTEKREF